MDSNCIPENDSHDRSGMNDSEGRSLVDFNRFVALDTETTGLDPDKGEIIELGAARFVNGTETESFTVLVRPENGITERSRRLTGIEPSMLAAAQPVVSALKQLKSFAGDDLLVLHNAEFDLNFISRAAAKYSIEPFKNAALCTQRLAALVDPIAVSYQLGILASIVGFSSGDSHRALNDARATGHLALYLIDILKKWPATFIAHLLEYKRKSNDVMFDLFRFILSENYINNTDWRLDEAVFNKLKKGPSQENEIHLIPPFVPLSRTHLSKSPSDNIDHEMKAEIHNAFQSGGLTLLDDLRPGAPHPCMSVSESEGAIPKLVIGVRNEESVADFLGSSWDDDGDDSRGGKHYLGRRSEYVCLRRAFGDDGRPYGWMELSPYERIILARWLSGTTTGRIGRISWWIINNFSGLRGFFTSLRADPIQCLECSLKTDGICFAERASEKARGSSRILVDSSHCFLSSSSENIDRLLESIPACLIENAGQVLNSVRKAQTIELDLDLLSHWLEELAQDKKVSSDTARNEILKASNALRELGKVGRETIRFIRETQAIESQGAIPLSRDIWCQDCLSELAHLIDRTLLVLKNSASSLSLIDVSDRLLQAISSRIESISNALELFRSIPDGLTGSIDGVPFRTPRRITIKVVPVKIDNHVMNLVREAKSGVVAVGRHLRSKGSFQRIRSGWNINDLIPVREIALEDHSMHFPPLFLPEDTLPPTHRSARKYNLQKYYERTANLLRMIADTLGGRTIVIFSSNHDLREVQNILSSSPPRHAIVLGQYSDGTRGTLIREYLENQASMILGGKSFLETADLRPAGFTVLVIVKIPFPPPDEPIHRASMEVCEQQGLDGYRAYLVPTAVDVLNQWIDSLIAGPVPSGWSSNICPGAVVILDPRPLQNEWGNEFIDSLACQPSYRMPFREMLASLKSLCEEAVSCLSKPS